MRPGDRPSTARVALDVDSADVSTYDSRGTAHHHRGTRSIPIRPTAIIAGLLLALAVASPVAADANLVASSPEDKAVVTTPPVRITLTFDEALDPTKSSFKLVRDGVTMGTGKVTTAGAKVMALDGLVLAPGGYEVRWTAGATDGHILRGTLTFTVAEPTPTPPSAAPPSAEPSSIATAAPSVTPLATPTPTRAPTPVPGGSGATPVSTSSVDVLFPIVAGLLVVVGIGAFVLRRSRKA